MLKERQIYEIDRVDGGGCCVGYTCNDKDEKQVLEKSEICEREQK